mmetsp:Transcript_38712/g.115050  ORF Transcript_38712/g.115050 Transcript_38712/m.115050 type:complete len:93 (-) Transcript_38712:299-577(-)
MIQSAASGRGVGAGVGDGVGLGGKMGTGVGVGIGVGTGVGKMEGGGDGKRTVGWPLQHSALAPELQLNERVGLLGADTATVVPQGMPAVETM